MPCFRRHGGLPIGLLLVFLGCLSSSARAAATVPDAPALTVFAASSLTNVLQSLGTEYTRRTGQPVRYSFASSATLARQLEAGAGADVFIGADTEWTDYLAQRNLLRSGPQRVIAGNRLVLVAPVDSKVSLKLAKGLSLRPALRGGRLAIGNPASVPAGRYAQEALQALGVWDEVNASVVRTESVRQALQFVARGEAPLGIVYATDARVEPQVRVVGFFPADTHEAIIHPAAVLAQADPSAARFVAFLGGTEAQRIFRAAGFLPPPSLDSAHRTAVGSP